MHRLARWVSIGVVALLCAQAAVAPASTLAVDVLQDPVLVSPVDVTTSEMGVHFEWERVPGAARYQVQAWYPDPGGELLFDITTVNDDLVALVDRVGVTITWRVTASDAGNTVSSSSMAQFTTVAAEPVAEGPEDGHTFVHPEETVTLRYTPLRGRNSQLGLERQDGAPLDGTNYTPFTGFATGGWRWWLTSPTPAPSSGATPKRSFSVTWPAATPLLSSPANGTTIAPGATRLTWAEVPGAGGYQIDLVPESGVPFGAVPLLQPWYEVPTMFPPGTATWRVRAIMAGSGVPHERYGPWSASRTFVVAQRGVPALQAPADGADGDDWPLLRWSPVPGARQYQVQVAASQDATAPGTFVSLAAFAFRGPEGGWGFFGSAAGTQTRWWRVRAVWSPNTDSDVSAWSAWRSFTVSPPGGTLAAPTAAAPLAPADCPSGCDPSTGAPILSWSPVPKAAFYRVFRTDDVTGDVFAWDDRGSTSTPVAAYRNLGAGVRAGWAVVACATTATCPETKPASWRRFAIALPAPTLLSPGDAATQDGPVAKLAWAPVADPVDPGTLPMPLTYELDRWTVLDGYINPYPVTDPGYPLTEASVVLRAEPDSALHWRVRVGTDALSYVESLSSPWSEERTVVRTETPLTLTSPAPGATTDGWPHLAWTPSPYAGPGYEVQIQRVGDELLWGPNYYRWTTGGPGHSITFPDRLAPGDYRWRVRRSQNSTVDEASGPWSAIGTFTVEGNPVITPTAPTVGSSVRADDVTFAWEPVPGATDYFVLVGTTPDLTGDSAIYQRGTNLPFLPVTDLLPEGNLYWKVCAPVDCSDPQVVHVGDSAVQPFHVTAVPGPDVSLPVVTGIALKPRTSTTLGTSGAIPVRATWVATDAGTGIATQRVSIRKDSGPWVALTVTSATRAVDLSLAPGHAYTLRIRVVDGVGNATTGARTITTGLRQESSSVWRWSSGWARTASSSASGGYVRWSKTRGASASATVNARAIALVAPRSTTRGTAQVWIDGVKVATVSLATDPLGARRLVYVRTWASAATHTVRLVVNATSGRPRVDVDALVTLR